MRRITLESITGNQEKTVLKTEHVVTYVWSGRLRNMTEK